MIKLDPQKQIDYKEYKYRYIIISLGSFASLLNGMTQVYVNPITVQLSSAYDVSENLISVIPICYLVSFCLFNMVSGWFLDFKGVRKGFLLSISLQTTGFLISCFVNMSFYTLIVGQIISSVSQPIISNVHPKIAVRWFKPQNRSFAISIQVVSNIVGSSMGYIFSSLVIPQSSEFTSQIQASFLIMNLVYLVLSILILALSIILFKEYPPTQANRGSTIQPIAILQTVKTLFKSRKFILLILAFGLVIGSQQCYGNIIGRIYQPYGMTSLQISIFAATMMMTGIVSASIISKLVKTKYLLFFRIIGSFGIVILITSVLCILYFQIFWAQLLIFVGFGLTMIPLIPLGIDFGIQIMFPISETQINGVLLTSASLFGVIQALICQHLIGLENDDKTKSFNCFIFLVISVACGFVAFSLFNFQLKRLKYEKYAQIEYPLVYSMISQ